MSTTHLNIAPLFPDPTLSPPRAYARPRDFDQLAFRVSAAKVGKPFEVPISRVRVDTALNVRHVERNTNHKAWVRDLRRGEVMPPIDVVVTRDGGGGYDVLLLCGLEKLHALVELEIDGVACQEYALHPEDLFAAAAYLDRNNNLGPYDGGTNVRKLVRSVYTDWDDQDLATLCRVTDSTVSNARKQLADDIAKAEAAAAAAAPRAVQVVHTGLMPDGAQPHEVAGSILEAAGLILGQLGAAIRLTGATSPESATQLIAMRDWAMSCISEGIERRAEYSAAQAAAA